MHIIHDNLEHLSEIDKGKIEDIEKNYDPKSEEIFKEIWDLSDTSEDESIVKTLGENLEKLNLETNQESDNSETSAETMIEKKTRELSPEKEKCEKLPESDASLSPIPRGEESSIVHSLGMVSKTKLDSATGTEDSKSSPQDLSRKYKYGTQVIHEENCECLYCYIKNSSKKNKWQGPALGACSCHLRFTPAAKSFSTFITVRLVVCLQIHAGCKFDSHTRYNHVTVARN